MMEVEVDDERTFRTQSEALYIFSDRRFRYDAVFLQMADLGNFFLRVRAIQREAAAKLTLTE